MTVAAWSLVWQVVACGACVSFFTLCAVVSAQAVRDARQMFHDLEQKHD